VSRRRRHAHEHEASHERWLVSYADFITLLFAFFVVMFASAYRDNQAIIRISHAIHNGFQSLGAFSGGDEKHAVAYSKLPREGAAPPQAALELDTPQKNAAAASTRDLVELRRQLEAAMGDEMKKQEVELRVTPEGFVISLHELGFFDSGQATLLPGASQKIDRIARILSRQGFEIRVEGHSDNQPIHNTQFGSNWELSTARAMSVLELLIGDAGFDPTRVSVAGYGQYRPIADDATAEGRRENRRVDLVVLGVADQQTASPQSVGPAGQGPGASPHTR
jgi:chemotaxis protein MotB